MEKALEEPCSRNLYYKHHCLSWVPTRVRNSLFWYINSSFSCFKLVDNITAINFVAKIMFCILIKISLRFVSKGLIDNNPAFGLDNGLAPNRRQAIIWTNADQIHWHIYAALGGNGLTLSFAMKKPNKSQLVLSCLLQCQLWKFLIRIFALFCRPRFENGLAEAMFFFHIFIVNILICYENVYIKLIVCIIPPE